MEGKMRETVFEFALRKFDDKFDKAGVPYMVHLKTVTELALIIAMEHRDVNIEYVKHASILHDILEDTDTTEDDLKILIGVNDEIIEIIKLLTRQKDDTYMQYIEKISTNKTAMVIKIADLYHNMQITRYETLHDETFSLLKRYHKAYKFLTKKIKENELHDESN